MQGNDVQALSFYQSVSLFSPATADVVASYFKAAGVPIDGFSAFLSENRFWDLRNEEQRRIDDELRKLALQYICAASRSEMIRYLQRYVPDFVVNANENNGIDGPILYKHVVGVPEEERDGAWQFVLVTFLTKYAPQSDSGIEEVTR